MGSNPLNLTTWLGTYLAGDYVDIGVRLGLHPDRWYGKYSDREYCTGFGKDQKDAFSRGLPWGIRVGFKQHPVSADRNPQVFAGPIAAGCPKG
jgi:hypothetical protein